MSRRFAAAVLAALVTGAVPAASDAAPAPSAPAALTPAAAANGAEGEFHPVSPVRVYDSRATSPLGPRQVRNVTIAGQPGVPASGVQSVVLNVTVDRPTADSYVSVFPRDDQTVDPPTSNLNFRAGQSTPNMVVARLGLGGQISVFNGGGTTHVLIDVLGWFNSANGVPGTRYHTVTPFRAFDTRTDVRGDGTRRPVGPGDLLLHSPTGGLSSSAAKVTAAMFNVTATNQTQPSYAQVFPFDPTRSVAANLPATSNLNFRPGQGAVPNAVISKVDPAFGDVAFYNFAGTVDLLIDQLGYFDDGSDRPFGLLLNVLPRPVRVVDTRIGAAPNGSPGLNRFALAAGETRVVKIGGDPASGVPASAAAAVLNLTVDRPAAAGFVSAYPADQAAAAGQRTSTVNFTPGLTVPNLAFTPLAGGGSTIGQIAIYNGSSGPVDVLVDVFGYFVAA